MVHFAIIIFDVDSFKQMTQNYHYFQ